MPLVKTNTFMSYQGGVTITPMTGSAVILKEVTEVNKANSDSLTPWQADGNPFPTQQTRSSATRGVTITSGDVASMQKVPRNMPCTIVATLYDSINGSGAGALTETWINAVVVDTPSSGPTNQFAGGTISFTCFSSDGVTDPYSASQA